MKKKATVKVFKKTAKFKNKGLKKEGEEKKPWFNEDEDWKKDGLEEPEEKKSPVGAVPAADTEDDWIEKDKEPDEEEAKIIEEDFPEEDDKDNY